jgi:hypothetical protein
LLSSTKASLSPNFAIETSAASLIFVAPSLCEISAEHASYWLNISIAFQLGTRCSDYALCSVSPRFRPKSLPAIIKVQHFLPLRLNIHPDHVLLSGPKIEFQRYGKKRDHQHLSVK